MVTLTHWVKGATSISEVGKRQCWMPQTTIWSCRKPHGQGSCSKKSQWHLHVSGCESTLQNFFKSLHAPEGINLIPQLYCRWLKWSKIQIEQSSQNCNYLSSENKRRLCCQASLGNPSIPPETERECNDLKEAKQKENSGNTQYFL